MSWSVLDANGCLKAKPGGAGASLPDPLTVVHGGTGLTQIDKSEMLYALTTDTMARIYVDTDLGTTPWKVMFNGGSVLADGTIVADNGPRWGKMYGSGLSLSSTGVIERPAAYLTGRPYPMWSIYHLGTAAASFTSVGWTTTSNGTQSTVTDTRTVWARHTTGAADTTNVAGFTTAGSQFRLNHLPAVSAVFRTGTSIANIRFYFVITSASPTGATDDFSTSFGCGMRYSTVAADPGFVTWTSDGTNQFIGTSAIAAIASSTEYFISVNVNSTLTNGVSISVNGVSQAVTLPSTALNRAVIVALVIKSTDAAATKFIDFSSMFAETQVVI
jgi:hypothetical protein